MQRKGWSNIMKIIEAKAKAIIDQVLKRIISKTGVSDEMAQAIEATVEAAASGDLSKLEGAAIQFVNATPVGKKMASAGLDVGLAVRMAKGDLSAIAEFAANKGIPKEVAEGLICLIQGDENGLVNALKVLVARDPLNLPGELVDIVVALVLRPGDVSRREVINVLGITLYRVLDETLEIEMPNFEVCKLALPLVFQAMTELFQGNWDEFLDVVIKINDLMLSSCEKKQLVGADFNIDKFKEQLPPSMSGIGGSSKMKKMIEDNKKQQKLPKPLFNTAGYPNYAVPRHLLSMIEFFKVPLKVLGVAEVSKARLKRAVCDLLMSFASVDNDIIDFLIITFAESQTRVDAVVRPGIVTREQQMHIVNEMSRELDLDHFVMKTLFKVVSQDKNFDERYFDEVKDRCRELLYRTGNAKH